MNTRVLVIGEKSSQVKKITATLFEEPSTIEKIADRLYLRKGNFKGKEFTFLPLIGHITNIDTHPDFGWGKCKPLDIVKNPKAIIVKENLIYKRNIEQKAQVSDELWLATDPDSEGDNIAYEAYNMAVRANPSLKKNTKRIWNSSLTNSEIIRAFKNPIPWEIDRALAVQGRRLVDAWVGFAGTREVTSAARQVRQIKNKMVLSVGRVQLPTLKIIIDRDREQDEFKSQLKYNILADVLDNSRSQLLVTVKHENSPFEKKEEVKKILSQIKRVSTGQIFEFSVRRTNIPPPRPLNTTDALAILAKELKIKADRAMALLATLYENGFISYPRTDNRRFKDQFPHRLIIKKLEKFPDYQKLINSLTDTSQVRTNGRKKGIEDHDPIHPTGEIPNESDKITLLHIQAWDYISRYYIGMFMSDLLQSRGHVRVKIQEELFSQKYQITLDEGWTKAITWKKPKESPLFTFKVNQIVQINNIRSSEFNTKPPSSWSDAKLIKQLENFKIGTKSSRPEIITKLLARNYIIRKKLTYEGTPLGHTIIQIFENTWPEVVTPSFTRMVEQQMDNVATKNAEYIEMLEFLRNYYIELHEKLLRQLPDLQKLLKTSLGSSKNNLDEKKNSLKKEEKIRKTQCPICQQGVMIERLNQKTKQRFFGCSQYPKCSWTTPARKTKEGIYTPTISSKNIVGPCPTCSGKLFIKKVKDFRLIGCTNYPKCKTSYFLSNKGRITILKKECPTCNRKLVSHISDKFRGKRSVFCAVCQKN